jgi:6-phosphogluconolactonase (cycloisomerase 2 family)
MKRSSKCIALLISILLVSFRLFSQVMDVNIPGKDMPAFVRIFENGIVQRYVIPDWEENPVIKLEGQNKTYNIDLGSVVNKNNFSAEGSRSDIYEWYEPGIPVEGDLPCDMAYSRDGSMFAVIYQHSDNVIFYDANSYAILATVRVGRQPLDIKMGVDHAYVCCHLGQEVVVISLNDFSVSNFVQVDGTPCQVELSPTEDTAYIACDSWLDGWMIAMNLQTNQVIYETYVPYFHHYGWGGGLGRELYSITKFKLSPHGDKFICADTTHRATIFNASTGQVEKLFNLGWRGAAYSPTGDTLFIYSNIGDSIKMYRINSADNSVIDFINVYADCFLGLAGYSDLAISHDGSRVMVNDDFNSRFCLFDFNTYTCQLIDEGLLYSDPPTYSTFDGVYGITCTYTQVKFLNFESGEIFNTYPT